MPLSDVYNDVLGVITNARSLASLEFDKANGFTQDAISQADSERLAALSILVPAPTLPEIPNLDVNQDFDAVYTNRRDSMWSALDTRIQQYMSTWMDQYVPKMDAQLRPTSDAWLLSVLGEGRLGIPAALELQIWDRARARELQDTMRTDQEAVDDFAGRGFSMPPGMLVARLDKSRSDASMKQAGLSRDVAIKQAELTIDVSKHAIEITTRLRLGVAQAIGAFFQAALAIPGLAIEDAKATIEAKAQLWQMVDAYVRGKVAVADIEWRWRAKQADVDLGTAEVLSKDKLARSAQIINTAISAAQTAASICAAALNAQQTLANVTYQEQKSDTPQ